MMSWIEGMNGIGAIVAMPTGADITATAETISVWDFMVKGGWMMVPIGLCSLVALTVVVERMVSLAGQRFVTYCWPRRRLTMRSTTTVRATSEQSPIGTIIHPPLTMKSQTEMVSAGAAMSAPVGIATIALIPFMPSIQLIMPFVLPTSVRAARRPAAR